MRIFNISIHLSEINNLSDHIHTGVSNVSYTTHSCVTHFHYELENAFITAKEQFLRKLLKLQLCIMSDVKFSIFLDSTKKQFSLSK